MIKVYRIFLLIVLFLVFSVSVLYFAGFANFSWKSEEGCPKCDASQNCKYYGFWVIGTSFEFNLMKSCD
jgi:hypothetical protein